MAENKDIKELVKIIFQALDNKKSENIKIINISDISVMADYFIICSGDNKHQILAMQDAVEEALEKIEVIPKNIEGKNGDTWILMDYRDIVVHIFDSENRSFYDLERLWQDGKEVSLESLWKSAVFLIPTSKISIFDVGIFW